MKDSLKTIGTERLVDSQKILNLPLDTKKEINKKQNKLLEGYRIRIDNSNPENPIINVADGLPGEGDLLAINNLSELTDFIAARENLGIYSKDETDISLLQQKNELLDTINSLRKLNLKNTSGAIPKTTILGYKNDVIIYLNNAYENYIPKEGDVVYMSFTDKVNQIGLVVFLSDWELIGIDKDLDLSIFYTKQEVNALESTNVKLTGNQTIQGDKHFTGNLTKSGKELLATNTVKSVELVSELPAILDEYTLYLIEE